MAIAIEAGVNRVFASSEVSRIYHYSARLGGNPNAVFDRLNGSFWDGLKARRIAGKPL